MDSLLSGDFLDPSVALVGLAMAAAFGVMTALVARTKRRSAIAWLFYGVIAPPFALLHAFLLAPGKEKQKADHWPVAPRRCPFCFEAIKPDLEVCPHCWRVLPADGDGPPDVPAGSTQRDDLADQ
jgi:hypothetical protein